MERQIFTEVDEMYRNRNLQEMEERLPVWKALDPAHPKTEEEEEIFPLCGKTNGEENEGESGGLMRPETCEIKIGVEWDRLTATDGRRPTFKESNRVS